jgi:hypothetical protein
LPRSAGRNACPTRILTFVAWLYLASVAGAAEKPQYNRDVRPILSEQCFACHGPDSASRKADLRLDKREAAVDSGAIVPGDPENSELVVRIASGDPKLMMPPNDSHKKLTAAQKETLRRWIAEGAEYQPHWSFIAPVRAEPPQVKNEKWVRTPIDRFILAELEKRGLEPAPEADRRTLARRLSLDLAGLPPKAEEVEAFVADKSADAYEKLVDNLLASARWGEHRGRYWLDAARYADTHGIHIDNFREMWSYRQWVIGAFNANMPFDRFTIEQLAGDLLPDATLDTRIASGFNRCNITSSEGGLIDEEYLVLYTRDRTETTSQVWMGLTAGCAVCHDHKFDPLTQREFYEMAAFFNNTTQAAKDGNVKDTPPIVVIPAENDRARWTALAGEIIAAQAKIDDRKQAARKEFDTWLETATPEMVAGRISTKDLRLVAALDEKDGDAIHATVAGEPREVKLAAPLASDKGHLIGNAFKVNDKAVIELPDVGDFDTKQPFSAGAWVKLPVANASGAIMARMGDPPVHRGWDLWLENGQLASHIIHQWPDNAIKVSAKTKLKENVWYHVFMTYDGSATAAGLKLYVNGEPQKTGIAVNSLRGTTRGEVPLKVGQRNRGNRVDGMLVQDLRIYGRQLGQREIAFINETRRAAFQVARPAKHRKGDDLDKLYGWWLPALDEPYRKATAAFEKLKVEENAIKTRGTIAHVMNERDDEAMAYVLFRGEYDKRRDEVPAETPDILPPMPPELPRNRLGLASWLVRPEHPLTARVTVNRFWQEVFGTGLVRTAGDFGTTGELPSHPELLDWLAVEFREDGWDVKQLFKLLVTSAAYRQAAITTPAKLEKDPQNRLLSRGPHFRMDAEMVRDYALATSGLLIEKIGGPSVKPYQPEGVWEAVAMTGSNTRFYQHDTGEGLYRRSLYTFWKRSAPPASMDIFNAPSREQCTVRRERTNTPLQALVTMNDEQFVEAARHLAETVLAASPASAKRLDTLARRLLARPLRAEEAVIAQQTLLDFLSYYQSHPDDAQKLVIVGESKPAAALNVPELAAWTMLGNSLMNLDEVLNK